ncbi:MAG TPA: hypothetical protein VLV90_10640 [Burkholderiales bacterium]|nr:hypothetical protein [Burkholderiales bacterium]
MKEMTQAQAQAEAIRRWGPGGTVEFRPSRSHREVREGSRGTPAW